MQNNTTRSNPGFRFLYKDMRFFIYLSTVHYLFSFNMRVIAYCISFYLLIFTRENAYYITEIIAIKKAINTYRPQKPAIYCRFHNINLILFA